jgi:hypothetical protein
MRKKTYALLTPKRLASWLGFGGPSCRTPVLTGWTRASCLALTLLALPISAQGAVTEFVVPAGPEITFQDGRSIDGHIVRMDQRDFVIRIDDGRTQTVPRSTVVRVAFETVNGERIAGELVGWTPGIYQIATPEAAIKIYCAMPTVAEDSQPVAKRLIVPETAVTADNENDQAPTVLAPAAAPLDAGRGSAQAIAALTTDPTTSVDDRTDPSDLIEAPDAAASPKAQLSIQVSVEHSKENGPPVAFNIELSEPSEDPVVLIYATIDGTAVRGKDYEPNRGVVMIQPGDLSARIEAPVIDDTEQEGQEHLQLFLTVDPSVAVVESRQIIANIDDDDQG